MQIIHSRTERAIMALLAMALCLTITLVAVSAAKSAAHAESRVIERRLHYGVGLGIVRLAHNRAALAHVEAAR